jgi:hypothetical protein
MYTENLMTLTDTHSNTVVKRSTLIPQSVIVWLALIAFVILVKFILIALSPDLMGFEEQFTWENIGIHTVIGLVGILFYELARFPEPLAAGVSNRVRFLIPIGIGFAIGIVAVLIDQVTGGTAFIEQQLQVSAFNVAFPASLFVYTGGLVLVEAFFHILPYSLIMFLFANVILRKPGSDKVFLWVAIIVSLAEPLLQGLGIVFARGGIDLPRVLLTIYLPYFITSYPLNLVEARYFKKHGYLAAAAVRLGHYLMWHVIYGSLIYPGLR